MFEWDEAKRRSNIAKHGVDFSAAERMGWSDGVTTPDNRRDYGEARFVTLGMIDGRLHICAWTPRGDRVRIISLRKANEREAKALGFQ